MKRQMLTLVGVLGMLLAAGSASAQTIKVKADVPFNFIINKATLPAGEYTLMSVGSESGRTLSIRSADKQNQALVLANHVESRTACETPATSFHAVRGKLKWLWITLRSRWLFWPICGSQLTNDGLAFAYSKKRGRTQCAFSFNCVETPRENLYYVDILRRRLIVVVNRS